MLLDKLKTYQIILASGSPRRKQLLEEMGIHFSVLVKQVDELFPSDLNPSEAAEFLSRLKADAFSIDDFGENTLIITADTIVSVDGTILGKPADRTEAIDILKQLSNKTHEVITGVTLKTNRKEYTFSVTTSVSFKHLSPAEIIYYVDTYSPYDKAGAYGIQEWIGHVAIEGITGSYFNVMGLPTHQLYEELCLFT